MQIKTNNLRGKDCISALKLIKTYPACAAYRDSVLDHGYEFGHHDLYHLQEIEKVVLLSARLEALDDSFVEARNFMAKAPANGSKRLHFGSTDLSELKRINSNQMEKVPRDMERQIILDRFPSALLFASWIVLMVAIFYFIAHSYGANPIMQAAAIAFVSIGTILSPLAVDGLRFSDLFKSKEIALETFFRKDPLGDHLRLMSARGEILNRKSWLAAKRETSEDALACKELYRID